MYAFNLKLLEISGSCFLGYFVAVINFLSHDFIAIGIEIFYVSYFGGIFHYSINLPGSIVVLYYNKLLV